jgi:25S rRNA (uracil2843-N3)-methyltransferase
MSTRRTTGRATSGKKTQLRDVTKTSQRPDTKASSLPVELQQTILNVFRNAFPFDDGTDLKGIVQEVKGHLFHRDFTKAFGKSDHLSAYALRWSASRALCYTEILSNPELFPMSQTVQTTDNARTSAWKTVCIGGGAGAEIVALAAAIATATSVHGDGTSIIGSTIEVTAVDSADWSDAVKQLQNALTTPPTLSAYASEAVRNANLPLVDPQSLAVDFVLEDVLEWDEARLQESVEAVDLCTVMFTLNELFSTSISKTTALLLRLGEIMKVGAQLLVVDSPGSYSEVKLGDKIKEYPMRWLLDHALMEVANGKWEKTLEDGSRWFRIDGQLKYPIDLENMRYQIHLYRRIES